MSHERKKVPEIITKVKSFFFLSIAVYYQMNTVSIFPRIKQFPNQRFTFIPKSFINMESCGRFATSVIAKCCIRYGGPYLELEKMLMYSPATLAPKGIKKNIYISQWKEVPLRTKFFPRKKSKLQHRVLIYLSIIASIKHLLD